MSQQIMDGVIALLDGRNALVTGAAANIGKSIALEMAHQGANVYLADIDEEGCRALEQRITALGRKSKSFIVDLSVRENLEAIHRQIDAEGVVIDILVNNVGIDNSMASDKGEYWQQWQKTYDTNVIGPAYLTKLFTDTMVEKNVPGSVLFITSVHQWMVRGRAAYSSSKAAQGMMVRELALALASHRIRVNGIAPGYVGVDSDGVPIPHAATPRYIGRTAVYLCSDYFSEHTTGSVLTLDSGLNLHSHLTIGSAKTSSLLGRAISGVRRRLHI
jgi:NAD(P)-dependent dehydrogenase (short-subunit alcohol dehydrogenase family)